MWIETDFCRIACGDSVEILPTLESQRIDAVVTDPPYHLTTGKKGGTGPASVNLNSPYGRSRITTGFMGKAWDGGDLAHRPEFWAEVLRVAKPGAHLLAFGGTRTFHRMTCAIEDAGWEIRDCIMWVYGSGFPKSLDVSKAFDKIEGAEREVIGRKNGRGAMPVKDMRGGNLVSGPTGIIDCSSITAPASELAKEWDGWGTALKPAWEPIVMARKPLIGTVAENVQQFGTGALNIDGCRIDAGGWYDAPGDRGHDENRSRASEFAMTAGSSHEAGRWPANLIHDGSEEVLANFPQTESGKQCEHGHIRNSDKTRNAYSEFPGQKCEGDVLYGDAGSAARFFYTAKASRADRGEGNDHPTVKPIELMRYLCKLVTPPGGKVLDPFMGSGTTICALPANCHGIGIELDEHYFQIALNRIREAEGAVGLFG